MKCTNQKHWPFHYWHGLRDDTREDVIKCDICKAVWSESDNEPATPRIRATRVIFSDDGFKYLMDAMRIHHTAIPDEIIIALAEAIEAIRHHYEDDCEEDYRDQQRYAYDTKHGDGSYAVLTGERIITGTKTNPTDLQF